MGAFLYGKIGFIAVTVIASMFLIGVVIAKCIMTSEILSHLFIGN